MLPENERNNISTTKNKKKEWSSVKNKTKLGYSLYSTCDKQKTKRLSMKKNYFFIN